MADAEPIRDHVLLGELALHPVGLNSMPQRTEEPCIVRRDLSAGTHISSLGLHEQKHHEQNCVLNGTAPSSVIASQIHRIASRAVSQDGDRKSTRLNSS